ncbi:MAG TPA: hypothetical protein VE197_10775, partial [Mycobacterium sp.]|nr:hypothetical protein [Mycobacterium sp.]
MIRGRQRPDEPDAARLDHGVVVAAILPGVVDHGQRLDTGNAKAPIAQRGKAKQKRADLRLVGLALVITGDGGVPVISHAYPGDRPDVTQFTTVVDELVA